MPCQLDLPFPEPLPPSLHLVANSQPVNSKRRRGVTGRKGGDQEIYIPHSREPKKLPSQKLISKLFSYNPMTGALIRKSQPGRSPLWNERYANKEAGWIGVVGYRVITINYEHFLTHRLVWKLVHGSDPIHVDHINGCTTDNRIENLRNVTNHQNRWNTGTKKYRDLPKGVLKARGCARFTATITVNGRHEYLGIFKTPEEASACYEERAKKEFGNFRRGAQ